MRDGLQNITHDRILMRVKDYLHILLTVGGVLWGGHRALQYIDRMNANIEILQSQVSHLQEMVVSGQQGATTRRR